MLNSRFSSLSNITNKWENISHVKVSKATKLRRLKELGFKSRMAKRKPLLSKKQMKKRLVWKKKHQNWTVVQWREVIWSDESKFCVTFGDGKPRVWRMKGEEYSSECMIPAVK